MIEIISLLNKIFDLVKYIESYFIKELLKKDNIIKAQNKYIKDLENFIESP